MHCALGFVLFESVKSVPYGMAFFFADFFKSNILKQRLRGEKKKKTKNPAALCCVLHGFPPLFFVALFLFFSADPFFSWHFCCYLLIFVPQGTITGSPPLPIPQPMPQHHVTRCFVEFERCVQGHPTRHILLAIHLFADSITTIFVLFGKLDYYYNIGREGWYSLLKKMCCVDHGL